MRHQYPAGLDYEVRSGLRQVVAWINELAVPLAESGEYDYIGHIGDDNLPSTPGWDVQIMEALEKTPFAYGNDLYPGRIPGALSCHVFMRSSVVRALGYFGPPGIRHMYVDVAWMAWLTACGGTYLNDVIIEHLHYTCGKAPVDESYALSTGLIPADLEAWHAYTQDPQGLARDLSLISALDGKRFQLTQQWVAAFNAQLNVPPRARQGWVPGQPLW